MEANTQTSKLSTGDDRTGSAGRGAGQDGRPSEADALPRRPKKADLFHNFSGTRRSESDPVVDSDDEESAVVAAAARAEAIAQHEDAGVRMFKGLWNDYVRRRPVVVDSAMTEAVEEFAAEIAPLVAVETATGEDHLLASFLRHLNTLYDWGVLPMSDCARAMNIARGQMIS